MSHRIIEKRRRDRMNNCLADLSRLIPTTYLKKGRGRIEKTEIIEMAIKHLKHLQAHTCKDPANCEVAKATEQDHKRQYRLGFQECMSETVRFLVEIEGLYAGDGMCMRLVNHLQKHYDKVAGGISYTQAIGMMSSVGDYSKGVSMEAEPAPQFYMGLDSYIHNSTPSEMPVHPESKPVEEATEQESQPVTECQEETGCTDNEKSELSEVAAGGNKSPLRVTSQLREMLQNPSLPKDHVRTNISVVPTTSNVAILHSNTPANGCLTSHTVAFPKGEEVYKFKNNIKHRFNADLRHLTSSPTGSHSEMNSYSEEERAHIEQLQYPQPQVAGTNNVHNTNGPATNEASPNTGCASTFPLFDNTSSTHAELLVKIPERNASDSGPTSGAWDSHGDCGSSCGSNPSPPSVARSNGSSSGYSTGGDVSSAPKVRSHLHGQSPATSPYLHTPENLSNRSPSPQPVVRVPGVPIFALHPKGTYYIPLTLDTTLIAPYFSAFDETVPILHPVSICVNFSFTSSIKPEKTNGMVLQSHNHQYLSSDHYGDRYIYNERHTYPCSPVAHN